MVEKYIRKNRVVSRFASVKPPSQSRANLYILRVMNGSRRLSALGSAYGAGVGPIKADLAGVISTLKLGFDPRALKDVLVSKSF